MDNYTLEDYKLLFQNVNTKQYGIDSKINFLNNNYTTEDVKDCLSILKNELNNKSGSNVLKNTKFLNIGNDLLVSNLLINTNSKSNTSEIFIKPLKEDKLNSQEINTYDNIISIDTENLGESFYGTDYKNIDKNRNDITVNLCDELENIVELTVNTLQIPYTFYNISTKLQNNYFYVNETKITLTDGFYKNLDVLKDEIQTQIDLIFTNLSITIDSLTHKINIENKTGDDITIKFFESNNKIFNADNCNKKLTIQNCLGWMLGCRIIDDNSLQVVIENNVKTPLDALPLISNPKYFLLSIDDYTNSKNDKSLIEVDDSKLKIKQTKYPVDEKNNNMNCITCDNMDNISGNYTKAKKYTQIEILKQKQALQTNNIFYNGINISNVIAIFPKYNDIKGFNCNIITYIGNDFGKNSRKYHGPVNISKLKITLYDNKGNIVDFNGCDWNISLTAKSLYKV